MAFTARALQCRTVLRRLSLLSQSTGLPPTISQLHAHPPAVNSTVETHGHITTVRSSKAADFVDLSDGTCHSGLNVVCKNAHDFLAQTLLKRGQSILVKGDWSTSPGTQPYELVYDHTNPSHRFQIIGNVESNYPVQKKITLLQHLRNLPTLRHRTALLAYITRFRSQLEFSLHNFFNSNEFVKVSPPIITSTDCEGAGEQFTITSGQDTPLGKFFGRNAYLTVSTQLHLEVLCQSLTRVWTLSPCFRAEPSDTNRHLSEFWMLEVEIGYITNLSQLVCFTEKMLRRTVQSLLKTMPQVVSGSHGFEALDPDLMQRRWEMVLQKEAWPVISYTQALDLVNDIMSKGRLRYRLAWGESLLAKHEKWLAGEHFKSPVFITDYPVSQKPFYMPLNAGCFEERQTVACFDLIMPDVGELIGGSMREHRYLQLCQQVEARGINQTDIEWYLDTRLNGTIPHGGFGLGLERLVMYLTAIDNVREIVPFPRVMDLCQC